MEKNQKIKTLDWIRAVRDEAYEEWRKDPLKFEKKRNRIAKEYMRKHGLIDKKAA